MAGSLYSTIAGVVMDSGLPLYREPLLGVAPVSNRHLRWLKDMAHPDHHV